MTHKFIIDGTEYEIIDGDRIAAICYQSKEQKLKGEHSCMNASEFSEGVESGSITLVHGK